MNLCSILLSGYCFFLLAAEVLRGKFAFQGYVVSDEGAIENIDLQHHYTKTHLETAVGERWCFLLQCPVIRHLDGSK